MWLGQLVFMLMCLLVALGMSAPLITRLFGPPANVQTSYYNLVNAPLAIAMGLLLGHLAAPALARARDAARRPADRAARSACRPRHRGLLFLSFLLSWMHALATAVGPVVRHRAAAAGS